MVVGGGLFPKTAWDHSWNPDALGAKLGRWRPQGFLRALKRRASKMAQRESLSADLWKEQGKRFLG